MRGESVHVGLQVFRSPDLSRVDVDHPITRDHPIVDAAINRIAKSRTIQSSKTSGMARRNCRNAYTRREAWRLSRLKRCSGSGKNVHEGERP